MPICIILVWFFASTGLTNVNKEMKKKLVIAGVSVFVVCSVLVFHIRNSPYLLVHNDSNSTKVDRLNLAPHDVSKEATVDVNYYQTVPSGAASADPVTHIAYIKTHKTGSSTIWSILINYAINHNLTLALPATKTGNKLGWPSSFSGSYAIPQKPDILCHHSRFSHAMLQYMPRDTKYLTSLRDPADQLRSAYEYFASEQCCNMTFEEFINKPNKNSSFIGKCSDYFKWWLMNGQSFDLGLDTLELSPSDPHHRNKVLQKISEIDKKFSMVLILERLDESLIVMRDLLNWTTEDIVYFKKNVQLPVVNKVQPTYTELQRSLAREWNWADELLHLHFARKLDATIKRNPKYYEQEVEILRKRCSIWLSRCVQSVIPSELTDNHYLSTHEGIGAYALTSKGKRIDNCILLTLDEVAMSRLLNNGKQIDSDTFLKAEMKTNI